MASSSASPPGGRASKRLKGFAADDPDSGTATLVLRGNMISTRATVFFNGTPHEVMLDTGSPLTFLRKAPGDDALRTNGATDGACYGDGEKNSGQQFYGTLHLPDEGGGKGLEVPDAAPLLCRGDECSCPIFGLSPRLLGPQIRKLEDEESCCVVEYAPDCIRSVMDKVPRQVVTFHYDPVQARSLKVTEGPSCVMFGKLYDDEAAYAWTRPEDLVTPQDWTVELGVSFVGPGPAAVPSQRLRVLVDTGCTFFKVSPAVAEGMAGAWGLTTDSLVQTELPARLSDLTGSSVVISVGGKTVEIPAAELFFTRAEERLMLPVLEGFAVGDGIGRDGDNDSLWWVASLDEAKDEMTGEPVLASRIVIDENMTGDTRAHRDPACDHDLVFGNSFMAALSSVAFDYKSKRIGFSPKD